MQRYLTIRRLSLAIALLPLLWAGTPAHTQDNASSEYLIKAGFIYNFASLVEWPPSTFPQSDSPIVIGILGEDHFGATLDRVLEGKRINGRGFAIKRFRSTSQLAKANGELKKCQILYVSSSEMQHLNEAIQLVKGLPILTIGETPGFANSGGMINLVVENNRVRFEVNVDAAKQADLSISSRLLALARIIQSPGSDGKKAE